MSDKIRLIRLIVLPLLLAAMTIITLIAMGIFDPQPVGELQWERPLPTLTLKPQTPQLVPLDIDLSDIDYSLRLTAVHQSGDPDSGYGLALGQQSPLIIALSPLGYTAIWQQPDSAFSLQPSVFYFPWQTWPHVRPGSNEIWVDVIRGQEPSTGHITIRLNRELLWSGDVLLDDGISLYSETFGDTAVVNFQTLQLFSP